MKVPGRFVGTQSLRRPRGDYGDYVLSRPDTEYKIRIRNLLPLGTRAVVEVFVDGHPALCPLPQTPSPPDGSLFGSAWESKCIYMWPVRGQARVFAHGMGSPYGISFSNH